MKTTKNHQSSNFSIIKNDGKTTGKLKWQNALIKVDQRIRMPRSTLHKHNLNRIDAGKRNPNY